MPLQSIYHESRRWGVVEVELREQKINPGKKGRRNKHRDVLEKGIHIYECSYNEQEHAGRMNLGEGERIFRFTAVA